MTLRARDITVGYVSASPVLGSLSVTIEPGRITAIVGPNGAGKTTLLRALLGLLRPRSGDILLDDAPLRRLPARARAARLAYVPQRPSLSAAFRVDQVVALGRHALPQRPEAIEAALDDARLADHRRTLYAELSVGQQQRVAIARALAQLDHRVNFIERDLSPPYLVADEPLSAMDPDHALQTVALLRAIAARGVGVCLVLHDLTMARRIADEAILLDRSGLVVADGSIGEALRPEVLERVFNARFVEVDSPAGPALLPMVPPGGSTPATISEQ